IERGMSREDCQAYLADRGIAAVKSACVFCPYRSEYGWARIRANEADWRAAVEYDRQLRDKRPEGGELFVHPDRVPLEQAAIPDLSTMVSLFGDEDDVGCGVGAHCGV